MPGILVTETDLLLIIPLTPRQMKKLRKAGQIPFVRLNRYTRLYNPEKVVTALEKQLETRGKEILKTPSIK